MICSTPAISCCAYVNVSVCTRMSSYTTATHPLNYRIVGMS